MVLSPDIWGRAGPREATVLDLRVTEHGPYARAGAFDFRRHRVGRL
ncbi:MAG: hypothetical protein JO287_24245 [Pseudonocardiales bacterium]|nr:hypothetical protein [Pseudonocardiales bacterium]